MGLVIVALVLFAGLIACWIALPGQVTVSTPQFDAEPASSLTTRQLA
jgi:hypothetical protein